MPVLDMLHVVVGYPGVLAAQRTPTEDTDDDTRTDSAEPLFPTPITAAWDADETDQLEQTITVPLPEDDGHEPRLNR